MVAHLPPRFSGGALTSLSGGLTNQSYRLDVAGQRFFLRQGTPMAARLGIRRQREQILHHLAAQAGLAPALHYADPERGLLITDWVDCGGSAIDWGADDQLTRLARQVARLHAIPVTAPALELNLISHLQFYLARICIREPRLLSTFHAIRAQLMALPAVPAVFCHNDIHPENVLGEALLLVDWEYAGLGDAAFDLAVICRSFALDRLQQQQMLSAYQAAGGACELQRVRQMLVVADLVALLWARVFWESTGDLRFDTMYKTLLERCQPAEDA